MTDERARPDAASPAGPRRRRRGRRGGGARKEGEGDARASSPKREAPKEAPRPSPVERTLEGSHIDASQRADVPLSAEEVGEAKQHLRFLFKNREILRLKVNAVEDLLLNGARAPTHRGQVVHLLGKVDLASVTSALTRVSDAKARIALLAGVVRFSSDVGILLMYLESLQDGASRAEAAAAFRLATGRIDFAGISSSRMRRVLDLVAATFEGHQRVQVLFGLLESATFRGSFEASKEAFPADLARLFVPLRVAYETIVEGRSGAGSAADLRQGVRALLDAPDEVLRSYPEEVRERLLERALKLLEDPDLEDRATAALLETLPKDSRSFSRLGMLRAAELLRRHDDDAARSMLSGIKAAHPGFQMPGKWLQALDAPRVARIALWRQEAGSQPSPGLASGFWLDLQRSVWARIGAPEDAERMTRDAMLQRSHAIAGVAPVLECGVSAEGVPYVVLPVHGRPLAGILAKGGLSREKAFALALSVAQVLHGLALAGLELPDVEPTRFLAADGDPPTTWLADMTGARRSDSASRAHVELARRFCSVVEAAIAPRDLPSTIDDGSPTLPDLVRSLAARG